MKIYSRTAGDKAPLAQADPYMIKGRDKRYYLYATEGQVYSSDSLFGKWRYEGIRLNMPGQKVCWAPSVIEIGEKYYMYYSSMDAECEEGHGQAMRVAVSDLPQGPFEYKKTLLPPFSIDAHVVITLSGQYMFYCNNNYDAERAGTRIMCDRMIDPYTMEGNAVCVVPPTYTYAPLLTKNDFVEGTGHNSVIFDNGKCYIIYHGRDYGDRNRKEDTRSARIDEMKIDGKKLTVTMTP